MTNARFCIIPARALGDKRLNRTDIMVLNALGMFGDKTGWSFPSTRTIGEMINAHRTSVSDALAKLVESGYIEARARYREDGGQTSNEYRILFDAPSEQGQLQLTVPLEQQLPPVADSLAPCSESTTPPCSGAVTPPVVAGLPRNAPKLMEGGVEASAHTDAPEKPTPDFAKVYSRVTEIIAAPIPYSGGAVHAWLAAGAIPEVDIYPVVERLIATRRDRPPRSLAYFTQSISDSIHARTNPMPKGNPHASTGQPHAYHSRPSKSERAKAALRQSAIELGYGTAPGCEGAGETNQPPVSVL